MDDVPDEVRRLVDQREKRRADRDFASADELRERVRHAGFEIEDTPAGPRIHRAEPAVHRISPNEVRSVLHDPPRFDVSILWLAQGWPQDVVRGIGAFRRHHQGASAQHVVVDAVPADPADWPDQTEVVSLDRDPGWGAGRNAGMKR